MGKFIDMTGWVMSEHGVPDSRLTVIKRVEDYIQPCGISKAQWLCECSCPAHNKIVVGGVELRSGNTKSCGCIHQEYLNSPRTKFNDYKIIDDIVEIYIDKNNQRYTVKVSLESLDSIKHRRLHLRKDGYVAFRENRKTVLLHRYLMNNPAKSFEVDHINKDKLDNRLNNLRVVEISVNRINTDMMKNNTSGVIGVTWDKSRNKWKASLNINHKCYNLGRFNTLKEAKAAREEAERLYHNDFLEFKRRHKNDKNKPNERIN